MKKTINYLSKILLSFAILISQLAFPITVYASASVKDNNKVKGIVYNPQTDSVGTSATIEDNNYANGVSYSTKGDVEIQKIVKQTKTLGEYEVEFKVRGIPVTEGKEVIDPVYVVIALDASNSMDNPSINKWNNAVNGAIDFEKELLKKVPNAKIALVKFAGKTTNKNWNDATVIRGFNYDSSNRLNEQTIGNIGVNGGATNLGEGLRYAYNLLNGGNIPSNAKKYVVVLSDGVPTLYTKTNGDSITTSESDYAKRYDTASHGYATEWADKIKSKTDLNATLISVGYELDALEFSKDKRMAPIVLKGIATGTNFYVDADMNDVVSKFKNLTSKIETTYSPGSNVVIEDKLGAAFSLVSGKTTLKLDKITEKWQSVGKFKIMIDEESKTNWYPTNDGFTWKYEDYKGKTKKYTCNDNPEVYWEAPKYEYVVNYYKDEITNKNDEKHFLGQYSSEAEEGTKIFTEDIDLLKYLPENYELNGAYDINGTSKINGIIINKKDNVINILYDIKKYDYTVNYYYADVNNKYSLVPDETKKITGVPHGTDVETASHYLKNEDIKKGYSLDSSKTELENEEGYTITENGIVIDIYYKRNSYQYTVNYHFNNVIDPNLTHKFDGIYGEKVCAVDKYLEDVDKEKYDEKNDKDKTSYFVEPTNEKNYSDIIISDDFLNNILNIYYVDTKIFNEKITKTTETEVIKKANTPVTYSVNYNSSINNIESGKEVEVIITDQLPYDIDEEKSNLYIGEEEVDVKYDKETKTITWTFKEVMDGFIPSHEVIKNFDYTVVYKNISSVSSKEDNYLKNTVTGKTKVGNVSTQGVTDSVKIKVEIKGKVIVNYVTTDGKKLTDSIEIDGLVGSEYKTDKKIFDGYSFVKVEGKETGIIDDDVKEITYVYEFLPLPPQTGNENSSAMPFLLFLLLPLLVKVIRK